MKTTGAFKRRPHLLALVLLLSAAGFVEAGWPPAGVPSGTMPWERPNFQGYSERSATLTVPPGTAPVQPQMYQMRVERYAAKHSRENPNTVLLMVHVPEHARVWVQDAPTVTTGDMRLFESPPLTPGQSYTYHVRIDWIERGRPVSQGQMLSVKAGEVYCVFIEKSQSPLEAQKKIEANLAKLSPEDQKLARAQKYCVVQSDKLLGWMGMPAKVIIKGQPVFLCCAGCKDEAESHPDQTLAKVTELKARK